MTYLDVRTTPNSASPSSTLVDIVEALPARPSMASRSSTAFVRPDIRTGASPREATADRRNFLSGPPENSHTSALLSSRETRREPIWSTSQVGLDDAACAVVRLSQVPRLRRERGGHAHRHRRYLAKNAIIKILCKILA